MPDAPDPLAAELAAIAERARDLTDDHDAGLECGLAGETCTGHDAERLLEALVRALELAGRWRSKAQGLDAAAEYVAAEDPLAPGAGLKRARSIAYDECAAHLERTLATALLGQDTAKGGSDAD